MKEAAPGNENYKEPVFVYPPQPPATLEQAREMMKIAKEYEKSMKKRLREESEREQSDVRQLQQKLRDAKLQAKKIKAEKDLQALSLPHVPDFIGNSDLNENRVRRPQSRIDKWQMGNRYARQEKKKWLDLVTVNSFEEVSIRLQKYGICIVNNMRELFPTACRPSEEQRNYITTVPQVDLMALFEGAIWSDVKGYVELHWPKEVKIGQRLQLKAQGHSGKWGGIYVKYKEKYMPQLETIIKAMFSQNDKASDPTNWKLNFNSIVFVMVATS
jgi:hypothetical protein